MAERTELQAVFNAFLCLVLTDATKPDHSLFRHERPSREHADGELGLAGGTGPAVAGDGGLTGVAGVCT